MTPTAKKKPAIWLSSGLHAKLWRQLQSPRTKNIPAVAAFDFRNSNAGELAANTETCPVRPMRSSGWFKKEYPMGSAVTNVTKRKSKAAHGKQPDIPMSEFSIFNFQFSNFFAIHMIP